MALFGGITIPGHPSPSNIRALDLLPLPQIRRATKLGIGLDVDWLTALSKRLQARMDELRHEIAQHIPEEAMAKFCRPAEDADEGADDATEVHVESAEKMAKLLFDTLGIRGASGQKLKRTSAGRYSTGKKQLETLKLQHPVVRLLLEYRENQKLKSTYTDKLPRIAIWHPAGKHCAVCGGFHYEGHYRVHTTFTTTRTDTGRLASKNPNLQNIPARSLLGRLVRMAFVAQKGYRLSSSDYAQIELRLLAHCAAEQAMLAIFRRGGDIHLDTAMRAFGIDDAAKVDKLLHRAPCKNVNFGIVYGLSGPGLYDLMALTYATAGMELPAFITVEWCEKFIELWFSLYPEARAYLDKMHYRAKRYGKVWDEMGRVRLVPEVRSCHERVRAAGLRQAGNMPIQGFAANVMKLGMAIVESEMARLRERCSIDTNVLLMVHDELVGEHPEDKAQDCQETIEDAMGRALWDSNRKKELCLAPILADGHVMMPDKSGVSRWEKEPFKEKELATVRGWGLDV